MDLSTLGRRLSDVEAEFAFGGLQNDGGHPEEHEPDEIDAVNDETFGGDVGPLNSELEDYAAQTACLRLDDWDNPCSSSASVIPGAPDASQIPMPFDFGLGDDSACAFGFPSSSNGEKVDHSLEKIDSLWNTGSSSNGVFNLWGDTSSKMDGSYGSFDATTVMGSIPLARPEAEIRRPSGVPGALTMPPAQATIMDETGGENDASSARQRREVTAIPSLPVGALSAEELERTLLGQDSRNTDVVRETKPQYQEQHQIHPPPTSHQMHPPPHMPHLGAAPPMFPPIPPMFVPFMPVWFDFLSGRIPYLPPRCPPVPPPVVIMFRQMKMGLPPGLPPVLHPQSAAALMSPQSDWKRRPFTRTVAPGMPSGKTIEDFAFDPFAGFMSCKEREWLVKIQILQCQGTGDPFEDDFYYASWRAKQLAAGWKPRVGVEDRDDGARRRIRERDSERNAHGHTKGEDRERRVYRAPNFAGSLGKPVSSTVYNPRHLIDVSGDGGEEEAGNRKPATQKKLRTMLLRLESAACLLMECAEKRRAVSHNPLNGNRVESDAGCVFDLIYRELFVVDQIPKTLQLSKGRALLRKFLCCAPREVQHHIVRNLFDAVPSFSKKGYSELTSDICCVVNRFFSGHSREELLAFVSTVNASAIQTAIGDKNAFARDLLCSLLLWCARRKASSAHFVFQWLRGKSDTQWDGVGWAHCLSTWTAAVRLSLQEAHLLADWLKLLSPDSKAQSCGASLSLALISSYS